MKGGMTKSKAAFHFSVKRLFERFSHVYLWTFTFPDIPPIPEARQRWRRVAQWLQPEFRDTVWGLRSWWPSARTTSRMGCICTRW